jgi:HEPN domain-containing protein
MTDVKELKSWIIHAEEDFSAAKALFRLRKPLLSGVCFHAQQSAEKYLKALLIFKDKDFPKTHDLPSLNTMCNKAGIITGLDLQQLVDLTEYAVRRRYPGDQPTREEAKEAIQIAGAVRRFARSFLGLKK